MLNDLAAALGSLVQRELAAKLTEGLLNVEKSKQSKKERKQGYNPSVTASRDTSLCTREAFYAFDDVILSPREM